MPSFGIGMINDDFHIVGIRQVVAERLKRAVMYSMALGPRCFKWKMLSLSYEPCRSMPLLDFRQPIRLRLKNKTMGFNLSAMVALCLTTPSRY